MSIPMIEHELKQILTSIPGIEWLRLFSVHGLVHPTLYFETDSIKQEIEKDREGDRFGPLSNVSLSLSERLTSEFRLGDGEFVAIAGSCATHFLLPVGDGDRWQISFVVSGHPSIDKTIQYFKDRDYLASLLPFLKTP